MYIVRTALLAMAVGCGVASASAQEELLDINSFFRLGEPEHLNPRFNQYGGQTTRRSYAGLVEIIVSGSGQDNMRTNEFEDAFWRYQAGAEEPNRNYSGFRLGSERQILPSPGGFAFRPNSSLNVEAGSIPIGMLIVAVEGETFPVDRAWREIVPQFALNHSYRVVLDLMDYSGTLTLGNMDGGIDDNSDSAYDVTLYSVSDKASFRRGDANGDEAIDISDAVTILLHLFVGGIDPPCITALDADDNGEIEISDAIGLAAYILSGGFSPRPPFDGCSIDPTPDETSCQASTCTL